MAVAPAAVRDGRLRAEILPISPPPAHWIRGICMAYQDKQLGCADCGATFTFTAAEQEFHHQKGFANEPRRCTACREKRKREGRGLLPGQQMHQTNCAGCGAPAEVPFVPRLQKPVYCRACFEKQKGGGGGRPRS